MTGSPLSEKREQVRIVCVSDIHESLIQIPECDLLLVAGDLCYGLKRDLAGQQRFLLNEFREWVNSVPAKHVVVIAGNHDVSVQEWGWPLAPEDCTYLQDSGARLCGLNIWGTPWQPYFYGWGFNAPERNGEAFLAEKFAQIPEDTDIVICHGPPRGYGDKAGPNGQPSVGSTAMTERLQQVRPRLMVCGHIHYGHGQYEIGPTKIVNAAVVDHHYVPVNAPVKVVL